MMNNDGGREVYCLEGGGGTRKARLVRDVALRPSNPDLDFF